MSHNAEHSHHITPPSTYIKVFIVLLIFMVLTIVAAQFHLPSLLANVIALTIAVVKATLVILFFMGVKYSTRLIQTYAVLGFAWVTLLGLGLCDYTTRNLEPVLTWEKDDHAGKITQQQVPPSTPSFLVPKHEEQSADGGSTVPSAH